MCYHEFMKIKDRKKETPSTVTQLASAMAALGMYTGENTEAEHAAEAKRLGSADYFRLFMANALLGMVETEVMLADAISVSHEQMSSAHRQARVAAGAEEDPAKLLRFLRWRTLRVEWPLREIAQNVEVGPVPLAAAHAAEGLQRLLEVCAAGQNPETASPIEMKTDLKTAREALTNAVANIDIMLQLIAKAEDLFSR